MRSVASSILKVGGQPAVRNLMNTPEFMPTHKAIVSESLDKAYDHWNARMAVHVWDRLELSDSKYETLRHLLSFVYDPFADGYVPTSSCGSIQMMRVTSS